MNSSLEILSRRLRLLCSLILLYTLTICISAAKFCVSETSRDSARAARFCVQTSLTQSRLDLYLDREGSVDFSVSNYNEEKGTSEVRIEYDLVFTFPTEIKTPWLGRTKRLADILVLKLYFQNQTESVEKKLTVTDVGQEFVVLTCSGAGIFEAGVKSMHSYSLHARTKEWDFIKDFDLKCSVSARQIF